MTAPTPPPLVTTREALVKVIASRSAEPREPFPHEFALADLILASGAVVAVEDLAADEALVEAVDEAASYLTYFTPEMVGPILSALAAALTARAEAPK